MPMPRHRIPILIVAPFPSRSPRYIGFDVDTSFGKKNTYIDLRSDADRGRVLERLRVELGHAAGDRRMVAGAIQET